MPAVLHCIGDLKQKTRQSRALSARKGPFQARTLSLFKGEALKRGRGRPSFARAGAISRSLRKTLRLSDERDVHKEMFRKMKNEELLEQMARGGKIEEGSESGLFRQLPKSDNPYSEPVDARWLTPRRCLMRACPT